VGAHSPSPFTGTVDTQLLTEFSGLSVVSMTALVAATKTPPGLAAELGLAANRVRGATAVRASTGDVAAAYRGFARQLGMDPERVVGTIEAITLRRLIDGGFSSSGLIVDAVALATIEFEVPITVVDDSRLIGPVDLLKAIDSSPFYGAGDLILADSQQPLARMFGEPFPDFRPGPRLKTARLVSVGAPGVEIGLVIAALERACGLIAAT